MKSKLDRREFLKFLGALSMGAALPKFFAYPGLRKVEIGKKNILIIVFDALSASHISTYGYARETMPNLSRLADRAIVYNNHYSGSNYTTPGTASILTGTLPWTNRSIRFFGTIADDFVKRNIFHAFPHYHRMTFSHNNLANTLLRQFISDIDDFTVQEELLLFGPTLFDKLFYNDEDISTVSSVQALKQKDEQGYAYSLFLSRIMELYEGRKMEDVAPDFPRGVPSMSKGKYYTLETAIDYLMSKLVQAPKPFLGYYHFYPPHEPYMTRKEFVGSFQDDNYQLPDKPNNVFSDEISQKKIVWRCRHYDEFILYVDAEFARLYNFMEQADLLDDTYIILTSDHGELFERSTVGHLTKMMYQPLIQVPLVIFEPGRKSRLDVYEPTSNLDIFPTLLHLDNQSIPDWTEGEILPPFVQGNPEKGREIITFFTRQYEIYNPITDGTATLTRGNYKLIYYFGYEQLGESGEMVELYDIKSDPEELNDLYPSHQELAADMVAVIKDKLEDADKPYQ